MNSKVQATLKTINNGKLVVHNVPYTSDKLRGEEIFAVKVMYDLAHIFQIMIKGKITEYDYSDYEGGDLD